MSDTADIETLIKHVFFVTAGASRVGIERSGFLDRGTNKVEFFWSCEITMPRRNAVGARVSGGERFVGGGDTPEDAVKKAIENISFTESEHRAKRERNAAKRERAKRVV